MQILLLVRTIVYLGYHPSLILFCLTLNYLYFVIVFLCMLESNILWKSMLRFMNKYKIIPIVPCVENSYLMKIGLFKGDDEMDLL